MNTRAVIVAALIGLAGLAACGHVSPEAKISRDGFWLDAYGFACECGEQTFQIIGKTIDHYIVRCPKCHHEWRIRRG